MEDQLGEIMLRKQNICHKAKEIYKHFSVTIGDNKSWQISIEQRKVKWKLTAQHPLILIWNMWYVFDIHFIERATLIVLFCLK